MPNNKYISYSTFKENQFISARTVRIKNLRQLSCQAASVLTIFLIVLYVVYLRIMFEGRSSTTPAPPKRKMGGVLTYEFGKIHKNNKQEDNFIIQVILCGIPRLQTKLDLKKVNIR